MIEVTEITTAETTKTIDFSRFQHFEINDIIETDGVKFFRFYLHPINQTTYYSVSRSDKEKDARIFQITEFKTAYEYYCSLETKPMLPIEYWLNMGGEQKMNIVNVLTEHVYQKVQQKLNPKTE